MFSEFMDLMSRGGPVMWVIFFTAWVAIIMLIERLLRIRRWHQQAIVDQQSFEKDRNYTPYTEGNSVLSPIGLLVRDMPWKEIKDKQQLGEQLNIQLAELMPRLEGTLPTIAIIGTLLPMLGLLGTVTGMINVFEVIAIQGTGDPQEMAHGISQALLTTASGLIIAIPVIFSHHLLTRKLRHVLAITEQSMHAIYNQGVNNKE